MSTESANIFKGTMNGFIESDIAGRGTSSFKNHRSEEHSTQILWEQPCKEVVSLAVML
jgi:hypothetical protein